VQFPIVVGLRRSHFMDSALLILTIIGVVAIALVRWPLHIYSIISLLIVLVAVFVAFALSPRIRALRIDRDGQITGQLVGKPEFLPVRLLPGATVHPWLTVLRVAHEHCVYRLVIARDSVAPEEFRRLRVWLRWRAAVNDGPGDP
jgi:hypothetical protein